MVDVEEQYEHPRPRVRGSLARFRDGVRLAAGVLRASTTNHDVIELLDGLGNLVLENLEVLAAEIGDRCVVTSWIDVDPNVVGFGAEGGARRLLLCARGRERGGRKDDSKTACRPRRRATSAHAGIMAQR